MRIRAENDASMTERLRGIRKEEPVTVTGWQELVFAAGAEFRLLAPAIWHGPILPDALTNPMLASTVEAP